MLTIDPRITCVAGCAGAAAPKLTKAQFEAVPKLELLEQVLRVRTDDTSTRHRVRSLEAAYHLTDGKVPCSNPDRRLHQKGCIVRTTCGLTIRLGKDCGADAIENYAEFSSEMKAGAQRAMARKHLTVSLSDVDALLTDLAMVEPVALLQRHLETEAKPLWEFIKMHPPGRNLLRVPRWHTDLDGKRVLEEQIIPLRGTELAAQRLSWGSTKTLRDELKLVKLDMERAEFLEDPERASLRFSKLKSEVSLVLDLLRRAGEFWNVANLTAVLAGAEQGGARVSALGVCGDGRAFLLRKNGHEIRLGLE